MQVIEMFQGQQPQKVGMVYVLVRKFVGYGEVEEEMPIAVSHDKQRLINYVNSLPEEQEPDSDTENDNKVRYFIKSKTIPLI